MNTNKKDLYRILQVDPAAEPEIIDVAYKKLALKYHPDVNKSPEAHQRMQEINGAYQILRDPLKRDRYDFERRHLFESQENMGKTKNNIMRSYGKAKTSYEVFMIENGWIGLSVLNDNKSMRAILQRYRNNPRSLLFHEQDFGRSNIRAELYLAHVMSDFRKYFEENKVKILF